MLEMRVMPYENQDNQYSPYYQHSAVEQDGSGVRNICQSYSYQPLGSYQSRPQQSAAQGAHVASRSYSDQGYGNVTSSGHNATYNSRNGYENERSSVDATNFGNLAYASSLSRARTPPQQSYPRNSSSIYALNAPAPASKDDNQGDGRTANASLGKDTSRDHPITHAQYLSSGYNSNTGMNNPVQPRYGTPQASHQPGWQYVSAQQNLEQSHATSGQGVKSASSGIAFPTNPSPSFTPSHNTSPQSGGQRRSGERSQPQHKQYDSNTPVSSVLKNPYAAARTQKPTVGHIESRQVGLTSISQPSNTSKTNNSAHDTTLQNTQDHPSSNLATHFNRQRCQQPTPTQECHPTTVDPSQVFNNYEYQQRKEEESAKTSLAEAVRSVHSAIPTDNLLSGIGRSGGTGLHTGSSQPNDVREAVVSAVHNLNEDDSATKERMESEMKQMLERMRDYKAKDPSLFLRIWEQVKKRQAPQANSTKPATQQTSASPTVTNGQLNSPMRSEHPSESETPTGSSFPPDFDRGRFPYQRRRPRRLISSAHGEWKSHYKSSDSSQPPSPIPQSDAVSSRPAAAVAQTTSRNTDQTEQRLYRPMTAFHQSLKTPTAVSNPPGQGPPPPPYNDAKSMEPKPAESGTTPGQSSRPRPPIGMTKWPEHRKRALAEAAATVLTRNPSNVGKQISTNDIHILLDQNPSYTEMCEHIESRGFVFERSQFAHFLLNAVPDIASQPQPNGYVPPDASRPAPSLDPKQLGYNYQRLSGIQSLSNQQSGYLSSKVSAGPSSARKPVTKEDKARKRNFSDIVDLTQKLSDDEDFGRYRSKSRMQESSQGQSLDTAKMMAGRTGGSDLGASHTEKQENTRYPPTSRDHILKEHVAEPMYKRRDARHCSSYDVKTIARDILISSGKHPTMAPLNHHLEILREKFDYVNNDSDLSTFRWDIVDPAEVRSGRHIVPAALTNIRNQDDGDKVGVNEVVRKPPPSSTKKEIPLKRRGHPKRGLSHEAVGDVYLRAPTYKYRPQSDGRASSRDNGITRDPHTGVFKELIIPMGNTSSLGREQQDANPEQESHLSLQTHDAMTAVTKRQRTSATIQGLAYAPKTTSEVPLNVASPNSLSSPMPPSDTSRVAHCLRCRIQHHHCDGQKPCWRCRQVGIGIEDCIFIVDSPAKLPALAEPSASVKHPSSISSAALASPLLYALPPSPSQKQEVVHGRKGRPPGAKNKQPRSDKGIPRGLKTTSPLTSKPMRPPSRDRFAPRESKGLRNSFSPTHSIAVVIQQRSPSVGGSESRYHGKTTENATVNRLYKCMWDQCPAKLHNLETFRKHVRKHRKGMEKPLPCKMSGCGHHTDEDEHVTWLTFKDEAAWDRHVEKKHVLPVAKRQGEMLSRESGEESSD